MRPRKKKYLKYILTAVFLFLLMLFLTIYRSCHELTVRHYTLQSDKIKQPLTMVLISDLHDHEFGEENMELVQAIRNERPDVIFMVGDMLNGDSKDGKLVCRLISKLTDIAPVYFSLGNHELEYMEAETSDLWQEVTEAGAQIMEMDYVDLEVEGNVLRIGGMYDYAFGLNADNDALAAPTEMLDFLTEYQDTDNFKIMLAHRPDSFIFGDASTVWEIDLVMSGHNHGGQVVLPILGGLFGGDQGYFPEYVHGLYQKDNLKLMITSGLGSDPKILPRINNLPEVAVITIEGLE